MPVTAQRYDFGTLPLDLHDRVTEGLANGAVVATAHVLRAQQSPAPLEIMGKRYQAPEASIADPSCQLVPICERFQLAHAATCLETAIYVAGWHHAHGQEAWVHVVRRDEKSPAHALVALDGQLFDPTATLRKG